MTIRFSPLRLAAALAAAGALTLSLTGVVSAHASLVKANIKPGQVFAHNKYPRTITAYFAENVKPSVSWVHVFEGDPRGDHGMVDTGKDSYPLKNPKEIVATLPKGPYTLMWYTTSVDDGHAAGNAFTFTIK